MKIGCKQNANKKFWAQRGKTTEKNERKKKKERRKMQSGEARREKTFLLLMWTKDKLQDARYSASGGIGSTSIK